MKKHEPIIWKISSTREVNEFALLLRKALRSAKRTGGNYIVSKDLGNNRLQIEIQLPFSECYGGRK